MKKTIVPSQNHEKTSGKVGRPKGEETSRIMIYLPVAMADAVREIVEREGMSLTGFFERLTRDELARRGIVL